RLTTTSNADGKLIADARAQVTLKKFEPNGPHCGTYYRTTLTYDPATKRLI
ncbi:MAG: hypothetical protein QOF98_1887, partial [Streptomyces sp.]|nr:hypothetical protein [Streptomyces sp.]